MFGRLSLSLTTRIMVMSVGLMIATGLAVAGAAIWQAQSAFDQLFETSQHSDNRAGLAALSQAGGGRLVTNGAGVDRVEMEALPAVDDNALVDRIVWMNGGVSTIFAYRADTRDFMRVSTTARRPDGSRGVGIALDTSSAVHQALIEKKAFYGPSVVAGVRFMSWFTPILNSKGELIGAIAVGNSVEAIEGLIGDMVRNLILASLLVVILGAGIILVAMRASVRPIQRLSTVASTLAKDQPTQIPYLERRDEVGAMAAALDVLAQASAERRRLTSKRSAPSVRRRLTRRSKCSAARRRASWRRSRRRPFSSAAPRSRCARLPATPPASLLPSPPPPRKPPTTCRPSPHRPKSLPRRSPRSAAR